MIWLALCAQASPLPPDHFDRSDAPDYVTDPNNLPPNMQQTKTCAENGDPKCMQELGDYFLSFHAHNPNEALRWHRKVALAGYVEGAIGATSTLCSFNARSWEYTEDYSDHADRFIEGVAWTLLLLESENKKHMMPITAMPKYDYACSLLSTAIRYGSLDQTEVHAAAKVLAKELRDYIGHPLVPVPGLYD